MCGAFIHIYSYIRTYSTARIPPAAVRAYPNDLYASGPGTSKRPTKFTTYQKSFCTHVHISTGYVIHSSMPDLGPARCVIHSGFNAPFESSTSAHDVRACQPRTLRAFSLEIPDASGRVRGFTGTAPLYCFATAAARSRPPMLSCRVRGRWAQVEVGDPIQRK